MFQDHSLRSANSDSLPEDPILRILGILQQHWSVDFPPKPETLTDFDWYAWIIFRATNELAKRPEERSIVLDDLIAAGLTFRLLMSGIERHIADVNIFPLLRMLRRILTMLTLQHRDAFRADESDIGTLLSVVWQHQNEELVVEDSWSVFVMLLSWEITHYQHRPQWQRLQDNGTIVLLLNCMRAFPDNGSIISSCVQSLALLVDSHTGNSARIADQGGLVDVVNAMIRFHEDFQLKGIACFFWMLVVNAVEGPVPGRFEWSDVVAEVLSAMTQFRPSGDAFCTPYLENSMHFLVLAAEKEPIRREILARNGVFEVVATMNEQPDDPAISCGCIDFFCQIAKSGQDDDVLLKVGALSATLAAMERFPSFPGILDSSCQMIRYLTDQQRGRGRLLVEAGVIEALVSVFQAAEHDFEDLDVDSVRLSLAALLHVVTSAKNLSDEQFLSVFNVCETVALGAFSQDDEIGATVASLAYVLVRFHRLPFLRVLEE